MLHYAAGVMAAVRQDPSDLLFVDRLEAQQHGPVVPSQYRRFNRYGRDVIPNIEGIDFSQFERRDLTVLDDVYDFHGQYSAWKLRNMAHDEPPWIISFERDDKTISLTQLIEFFSNEIDESYIAEYQEAA